MDYCSVFSGKAFNIRRTKPTDERARTFLRHGSGHTLPVTHTVSEHNKERKKFHVFQINNIAHRQMYVTLCNGVKHCAIVVERNLIM